MIQDIFDKVVGFIKAVFSELKFVEFPTRKETLKIGNTVIMFSIVFATCLYMLDWLFQVLRTLLTSIKI
jgi:preprotein translocase SecE subunit